jgi:tryptophan 2,3-dioxygenase
MKKVFDSFTRAQVAAIALGNFTPEVKAILKNENITHRDAIAFAKEALKYMKDEEATAEEEQEEEIDPETYFMPEDSTEPSENEKEQTPVQEPPVQQEQKQEAAQEPKKRTAAERMQMLKKLEDLTDRHTKTVRLLERIEGMKQCHNESEGVKVTLSSIDYNKFPDLTITKNLAVKLCINYVFEETQKQIAAIENEIENLAF